MIAVFCEGGSTSREGSRDLQRLITDCMCLDEKPVISALINRTVFAGQAKDGRSMYETAARYFEALDLPVFNPIVAHFCTLENWRNSDHPLMNEIPWSYLTPEMQGMIEPVMIGLRSKDDRFVPLPERVQRFAGRVAAWVALREKPMNQKKLALILHNCPCSGVEATVGFGYELNVFESAVLLLRRLAEEGFHVNPLPADGEELKQWIMEKKAIQDFRWTSVSDIEQAGGILYRMPLVEYLGYYSQIPEFRRKQMEEMYGDPPGEGMVLNGHLIITGLDLGSVQVMLQPKRGCYGPKCTGEVCKILQSPYCPPPHQFIATYRYLTHHLKVDAMLHFGTHGAVDFLPGKSTGLSGDCWPDIVLHHTPNLYLYNSGVPSEALVAKRRTYAAMVDHLPAVGRGVAPTCRQLAQLLNQYQEASQLGLGQQADLLEQVQTAVSEQPELLKLLKEAPSQEEGLRQLRQWLLGAAVNPSGGALHVLGRTLTENEQAAYVREVWMNGGLSEEILQSFGANELDQMAAIEAFILQVLRDEADPLEHADLIMDVHLMALGLDQMNLEMDNLVHAIKGGYIPPGIYGAPDDNGREVLPTGRNLYTMAADKIPTKAAWKVGEELSLALIEKYLEEEGKYPDQVSMNMISQDITRAKGEQLSQLLHLMGVRPKWAKNGRVLGLELISLEELQRPRIDVLLRITGVMRDSWPDIVALIDDAVLLVASQEENPEDNYIRKHSLALLSELQQAGIEDAERRSTIRIFGDPPGAFGADVDLALKASAWKDEKDLVRYFIQASSHAYGRQLSGDRAVREFVSGAKRTSVSYDITSSRRYDVLDSSFSAEVQGGFGLISKTLLGKKIRQYQGSTEQPGKVRVLSLADKLRECVQNTMLNPFWQRQMMDKGYEGGGEIMSRLQNVFSWQMLTEAVGNNFIDTMVEDFVLDSDMRQFLQENNRFALEEVARRFLELHTRGKWQGEQAVLEALQGIYLEIEGDMEEGIQDTSGDLQAGAVEIYADDKVDTWNRRLREVDALLEAQDKR